MFHGPEAVRDYLLGKGIRYLAFVRGDYSRYLYRRTFWEKRIFVDASELWQTMGAYIIAGLDNFEALARTSKVLFERDGTVLLDLGEPRHAPALDLSDEPIARVEFLRQLSERLGVPDAWSLLDRHDVRFEDGFSPIAFENPDDHIIEWYETCSGCVPMRGQPVRWINRRAHLRVRGDQDMRLVLDGRIAVKTIYTRPRVEVMIDGRDLGSWVVEADGWFHLEATVAAAALDGWTDLYITVSSVSEPWREPGDLRAAELDVVRWEPATAQPATR
jgi:hypothetical protein